MMEKKGCQVALVGVGVAMAAGMILSGVAPGPSQDNPAEQVKSVFKIGNRSVGYEELNEKFRVASQNTGMPGAQSELDAMNRVLTEYVRGAAIASLATERGVSLTTENLKSTAEITAQQYVEQVRMQLSMTGQVSPTATPAESDKKFKEITGKTPAEATAEMVTQITSRFNDEKEKPTIIAALLPILVQKKYEDTLTFTEEDLKNSFAEYKFSVIRFDDLAKDLTERQKLANETLTKIKGGADFAKAQTEAKPNAKPEEKSIGLTRAAMESTAELTPLGELKVGGVSEVVLSGGSPAIYKLIEIKPNLPKDFDKTKASLLAGGKTQRAQSQFQKDLQAKVKGLRPTFNDPGLEFIYGLFADSAEMTDQTKLKEFLAERLAVGQEIAIEKTLYPNLVAATVNRIVEIQYSQANATEQEEMIDQRLEAAEGMLEYYEDGNYRLQLAEDLLGRKRTDDALLMTQNAAANNADFEQSGQIIYDRTKRLVMKAEKEKSWSAEAIADLRKELTRWETDRAQYLAEQKELEEAQKKAEAELDKENVDSKGNKTGGTSAVESALKPDGGN
jgi:hypothetical protein